MLLPAVSAPEPELPAANQSAGSLPRQRILVVDDNQDSALSLEQLLTLYGHEVHTAYDGIEAVEAAARLHPAAILQDVGLPKLSGYDAARRIREQNARPRPIIIAVTGWGQEEDRQASAAAGFDGHVIKPVNPQALIRLVADLLKLRPTERPRFRTVPKTPPDDTA